MNFLSNELSGLYTARVLIRLVWRLRTVTPLRVTSAGRRLCADAMRFCTLTMAMSPSVPWRKYIWMLADPELVADDTMYIMSSTPLIASSSGTSTLFCTVSAFAPAYAAETLTVGGAISGNCSTGSCARLIRPTRRITIEITPANIGLSMNVFTFIIPGPPLRSARQEDRSCS